MAIGTDIGLALASEVGDVSQLQTASKQLVGALNEVLSGAGGGDKQSSFIIAPSNAVNKDKADLVLTGTNDVQAINLALDTLRGIGTQAIRVDFLGGDIIIDDKIVIPNNCKVYGNGCVLNQVSFTGKNMTGKTMIMSGITGISIEGFTFNLSQSVDTNGGSGEGINLVSGKVLNCTIGNIFNRNGISMVAGDVSNCIFGNISTSGKGVYLGSGRVTGCTFGNISGYPACYGIHMYGNTGTKISISACTFGNISESSSAGIYVNTGTIPMVITVSDCVVGNVTNYAYGINVSSGAQGSEHCACIVSRCNVGNVSATGFGICVSSSVYNRNTEVSACTIYDVTNSARGIYVPYGRVIDCIIPSVSNYGIGIHSTVGTVSDCYIKSVASSAYGIKMDGSYPNLGLVINNKLDELIMGSGTYIFVGSSVTEKNNLKEGSWTNYGA